MAYMNRFTNYNDFVKQMFSFGFDWMDIEYYWRNQEEFEKLCKKLENKTKENKKDTEYWEYINNI